jgi:hypothetical protein
MHKIAAGGAVRSCAMGDNKRDTDDRLKELITALIIASAAPVAVPLVISTNSSVEITNA